MRLYKITVRGFSLLKQFKLASNRIESLVYLAFLISVIDGSLLSGVCDQANLSLCIFA
ncbi:hypothetical protein TUM4438_34710 [Shewanella sairae]|uniref:Uncharacterized protein n=1 Tax=Shewanella sairae TaxID=190310 RepID=A0ABQ4PND8_9GAMM|nr:hypothetical protein TUM4438_34710 [Shewanella sairae]